MTRTLWPTPPIGRLAALMAKKAMNAARHASANRNGVRRNDNQVLSFLKRLDNRRAARMKRRRDVTLARMWIAPTVVVGESSGVTSVGKIATIRKPTPAAVRRIRPARERPAGTTPLWIPTI